MTKTYGIELDLHKDSITYMDSESRAITLKLSEKIQLAYSNNRLLFDCIKKNTCRKFA